MEYCYEMVRRIKNKEYTDSLESLTADSTFQRVSSSNIYIEYAQLQNISVRPITIRIGDELNAGWAVGKGTILSQADSNGQGGGVWTLPRPNLYKFWWATTTATDNLMVVRLR